MSMNTATPDTGESARRRVTTVAEEKMLETLNWAYTNTLNGLPGQKSVYQLVRDYLEKYDANEAEQRLVQFQTSKAATAGFVTGLGGLITLPVAVPANVATVILVQMRMIAAIALMHGYDLHDQQVRTFVYATLTGSSVADIVKQGGLQLETKMGIGMMHRLPTSVLRHINQRAVLRLVTKFGTTGAVNLGKVVPVIGGIVSGSVDTATTLGIAHLAHNTFALRTMQSKLRA